MQALVWILRFFIVVILVWFAVKNSQLIDVHGFPDQKWQAPLVFVLLVTFVAGVVIGLLAWIPTVVRQRRELTRLRKAVEREAAAAALSPPKRAAPCPAPTSMEFELWWLLALPVFFGMGWIAARIDLKSLLSESRALPSSYFRGLNFLLKEQPDKAIESFLQVAKENPQTVELQFALGSLFRRRGEVDRAIRMHQDLVNREDLPAEQRREASFELAEDYFKAGLLDHAEQVLTRLDEGGAGPEVHRHLLDIYIQEKDWAKAIEAAKKLEVSAKRNYQKEIANYHCELAITEDVHGRGEAAEVHLAAALAANRKCVRANLLRGEWLARAGRHAEALEAWKAVEHQDPAYFGLVAEGMVESYKALGRGAEGLALLRGLQHRYPGLDLLNVVYQVTAEQEGDEAAWRLVRDEVRRNPTLVGLDRLIDAELVRAPADRRQDLQLMKNLVHSHAQALAVYLCANCGFKARQFFWQCPACGGWETFPPRRTAELDTAGRHLARMQLGQ